MTQLGGSPCCRVVLEGGLCRGGDAVCQRSEPELAKRHLTVLPSNSRRCCERTGGAVCTGIVCDTVEFKLDTD